jgi:predicted enzyme related to lactoylglutathione lyase
MKRVVHFEITADSPERAIAFYEAVFEWKTQKWDGPIDYWLTTTGEDDAPGINGAIKHRAEPQQAVINTIDVPSIDEFTPKIKEAGGEVVMPKTEIPGVGFHAYCKDTEGNIIGLFEGGPSAQ